MDQNGKDDLKTQFVTREGTYRLMTLSEYSRPNRVGYQSNQNNPQVRVSLITLPSSSVAATSNAVSAATAPSAGTPATATATTSLASTTSPSQQITPPLSTFMVNGQEMVPMQSYQPHGSSNDRICFNFGKELYVYAYRGVKKNADLCKPIDKKLYKGTNPSCHDFNQALASNDSAPLLVGFTTGQIQLVQPGKREPGRLYNEERLIDKTKVTCLKWLPKSPNLFLASHASGHLYLYNEELPCTPTAPSYQHFKMGDGFTILTCKSKSTRNPLYKWSFGTENCSINEFGFSPCGSMLAVVSQDGFLRVFHYDTMELQGIARSYFGGFLCVCWSPDGKFVVVGGEDDLVTVWSLHERCVVARGTGHRSWVSVVAFDPYTSYSSWEGADFSDDENATNDTFSSSRPHYNHDVHRNSDVDRESTAIGAGGARYHRPKSGSFRDSYGPEKTSYRLGSVGQDTQICLWDITEDHLRQSYELRHRLMPQDPQSMANGDVSSGSATADNVDACGISKISSNNKSSGKFAASGSESIFENSKQSNSNKNNSNNAKNVIANSVNTNSNCVDTAMGGKSTDAEVGASSNKTNNAKINDTTGGLNAFNSITQRLSNFSFGNDKKSADGPNSHKKTFTFSKSTGNHLQNNAIGGVGITNGDGSSSSTTAKNSKNTTASSSVVPSYDPMKLIGTPACPRFDQCQVLLPLVCKKIAHERLTALIFREDCFLTACQDGFIYTWARPGVADMYHAKNIHPNVSNSPGGAPGGTVV